MKLLILFLICILISGCNEREVIERRVGNIRKIEYEGHTYLIRDYYHRGGICHDENCKCKKLKNEN